MPIISFYHLNFNALLGPFLRLVTLASSFWTVNWIASFTFLKSVSAIVFIRTEGW